MNFHQESKENLHCYTILINKSKDRELLTVSKECLIASYHDQLVLGFGIVKQPLLLQELYCLDTLKKYHMRKYSYHKRFYTNSSATCSRDFEMNPPMPAVVYLGSPIALEK